MADDWQRLIVHIPDSLRPTLSPLVRASGSTLTTADNQDLLDLSGQTLNLALGQNIDAINDAVITQIQRCSFASSRFGSIPFLTLSQKLVELSPPGFDCINLKQCDGSDAVETALKIARIANRNDHTLSLLGAWHGETCDTLNLCSRTRNSYLRSRKSVTFSRGSSLESMIEICAKTREPATVILDPVGVSVGLFDPASLAHLLGQLVEASRAQGHIIIFDEVQTFGGFLWPHLFATEWADARPDIICIGKALGAGFPIAATIFSSELRHLVDYNEAEFTHGGQPPACAAGLAALEVLSARKREIDGCYAAFCALTAELRESLQAVEVRQIGFFCTLRPLRPFGASLVSGVYDDLLTRGVVVRKCDGGRAILVKPCIISRPDDLERGFGALKKSMEDALMEERQTVTVTDIARDVNARSVVKKAIGENPNMGYVQEVLAYFEDNLTVKLRSGGEQRDVSQRLAAAGIPCCDLWYDEDSPSVVSYPYVAGARLDSFLQLHGLSYGEVSAICSKQVDYIRVAHEAGIVVGDRWPGNIIVNGASSVWIDFDITYEPTEGNLQYARAFEHFFFLFHMLMGIGDLDIVWRLCIRFGAEFIRLYPGVAVGVLYGFWRCYADPAKPENITSLKREVYRERLELMLMAIGLERIIRHH